MMLGRRIDNDTVVMYDEMIMTRLHRYGPEYGMENG